MKRVSNCIVNLCFVISTRCDFSCNLTVRDKNIDFYFPSFFQEVFNERIKLHKTWKDAETLLSKKQEERTKFEQQHKMDKVAAVSMEIIEVCFEKCINIVVS